MAFRKQIQRTAALESLAWKLDMDFQEKDEFGLREYMNDFKLFRVGGHKRITNIVRKTDEDYNHHGIFDYRYSVSTGNSVHTYKQTVFFYQSKTLKLPHFRMVPEHVFHKIGDWFGIKDIDFQSFPTFSSRYYLRSDDPDGVRSIFPKSLLEYFSQIKGWSLEGIGYYLIWYRFNKRSNIQTIPNFLKSGIFISDAFEQASKRIDLTLGL